MSSDARIRFQRDGQLRGTHDDGPPCGGHALVNKYELSTLMRDIETCMQSSLVWEISDSRIKDGKDERYYLAGWMAR